MDSRNQVVGIREQDGGLKYNKFGTGKNAITIREETIYCIISFA
jgi:hypothetical protein